MKEPSANKSMGSLGGRLQGIDPKVLPLLWGGALALFLIIDLVFVMGPQVCGVAALAGDVGKVRRDIDTFLQNKQRLVQLTGQRDTLMGQVADFDKMVYRRDDLPRVLQKISTLANRDGVQIDQVTPQKDVQSALCTNQDGKYFAVPVMIQARSGFRKFETFLSHLERDRIFWQVDSFSFVADPQYPQRNQVKFLIKVIVLDK